MLEILHRIVNEVAAASGLDESLRLVVHRVRDALLADVCSVYLADDDGAAFVLRATEGLNPAAIGRVRLRASEGLVGMVAERQEPVHLVNASEHPRFVYFPVTGEERYRSFLGVPIVHYRKVVGVLVAQQREQRLFAPDEVAFLVTIAAQLAGAIEHAAATGELSRRLAGQSRDVGYFQGAGGTRGVAIGTVALCYTSADLDSVPDQKAEDVEAEIAAFSTALAAVRDELEQGGARMANYLDAEERALFDVHLMLLSSARLSADVEARIRAGLWAPAALRDAFAAHAQVFLQMEDPYLRARADDLLDIGRRILLRLETGGHGTREYPDRCVLVGDTVSIAQIAEVPAKRLVGIVSRSGYAYSHTAVLARALGIPAIMGVESLPLAQVEGRDAIVDGNQARLFIEPARAVLSEYRRVLREQKRLSQELQSLRDEPAETPDGHRISLQVNTGLVTDSQYAIATGADGIGLYRTEIPFMVRSGFPGEDEQYEVYREVLATFAPRFVTMRVLDVGGDKPLPYFTQDEPNPFLGWRGIRILLDHPEIFLTQLRAMLRASEGFANLRVLFPMVSRTRELVDALELLHRAHRELVEEGRSITLPPAGVMIEVPAAVYQARELAALADFVSIGSNDLTQYLLAVDRNNPRVATLYESLHPAVLQALSAVVEAGHRAGRTVCLCGELAADPAAVVLALGMGMDALSMAASAVPKAKWVVRSVSMRRARALFRKARTLDDASAIRALAHRALERAGLGSLVAGAAL